MYPPLVSFILAPKLLNAFKCKSIGLGPISQPPECVTLLA